MSKKITRLEEWLSHNSYDVLTSDAFQEAFEEFAEKQGMDFDEAFDWYLMCITGEPLDDYTTEDVHALQKEAVKKGLMEQSDVDIIWKVRKKLNGK